MAARWVSPRWGVGSAIALLLALAYGPLLWHWVDGWLNKSISLEHEYFSYGLIGWPFAAYLTWLKRRRFLALPGVFSPVGLAIAAIAVVFYGSGITDLVNLSLPLWLLAIAWWWKGRAGVNLLAFPFVFALLATPNELPYLISPYTLGLQKFIAGSAGFILNQFDLGVTVEGIYLYVRDRIVEVAPHCSGLKMLLTSLYVSLILAYWTDCLASRLKTGLLFGGAIFISVFMNILRNTLLTFFHGTGQDSLFDLFHEGVGGDIYSAGMLGMIILWYFGIEKLIPWLFEDTKSS